MSDENGDLLDRLWDDGTMLSEEAAECIEELERIFELRWAADMRAVRRWKTEKPGRDLEWPDHTDLCVWLLNEIERLELELRRYESCAVSKV